MKPSIRSLILPTGLASLLATAAFAAPTGIRSLQQIPMGIGAGEVIAFSPTHATLAVTDNPSGGVRLFRHDGSGFASHAVVDIAAHFTAHPVSGFAFNEVTSVALDRSGTGLGVATVINGSPVTVGSQTYTATVPQIGRLVLFNLADGAILGSLPLGYHPDMVTIHQHHIAVANEGQHAWNGSSSNIAPFDAFQQPGSVSLIDISSITSANLTTFDPGTLTVVTLDFSAVPSLIAGLRDHTSFEAANTRPKYFHIEPEYLVFNPEHTKLFVTLQENNAIATLDLATLTWEAITPLGTQSMIIDASDSDKIFDPSNPVLGLPMPDAIASWNHEGSTYLITADEGDARVDDGDVLRLSAAVSTYGFAPGFSVSTHNNDYGRLNVLRDQILNGPVSPASDIDRIVSLGTRGLSLWRQETDGSVSKVAHLPLETELFSRDPSRHNSNNGGQRQDFDSRSDDKGPEPEAVAVTTLADGTVLAIAGMERQNGLVVVNLTNPAAPVVTHYINESDKGLISPETIAVVPASESPTGNTLAIVGYEGTETAPGGVGIYEINPSTFRLQILHASDMEADLTSIAAAPKFAALVDRLEDDASLDASVTLGAGDCFIPGAFLSAGNDPSTRDVLKTALGFRFGFDASGAKTDLRENPGRPDIAILNAIGFDATCIGNHEFDLGATEFANIVLPDPRTSLATMRHYGAAFPFLSANLSFAAEATLDARATSEIRNVDAFRPNPSAAFASLDAAPTRAKLAKAAIIERGGQKIGVLGVTPPDLANISSPGLVQVTGPQGATQVSPRTYDLQALADHLQPVIDDLVAAGCNKIILSTQLQQLENEKQLAPLLRHVDIIIAGGSGSILAQPGSTLQPGDSAAGTYPFSTTDLDGNPVAIVSGDGQYQYLGRLVVEFDAEGRLTGIDPVSNNLTVNDATVSQFWPSGNPYAAGTRGGTVKALTDAVQAVIQAKDGLILGRSSVALEGRRTQVRQQETNLGNLSADANLWYARRIDPTVEVSLKNGGGIRNSIGSIDSSGTPQPTLANPSVGKVGGDISRLDIEDSLKFNNSLTLQTVTAAQLKVLLEHGVAGNNGTGADRNTPGQFCQIGGLQIVADLAETPLSYTASSNTITAVHGGSRIRYAALVDDHGQITEVLVSNGEVLDPERPIRLVTLTFLANAGSAGSDFGGDNYPLPWAARLNADAQRVDLTTDGSANQATFAAAGTEQDAFAEYLLAFHQSAAYAQADTSEALDRRILQGNADSDGDGIANGIEVAALGLDPDQPQTASQISAALLALREAGRQDVTANPGAYDLYTADSIQDLRGTGVLLQAGATEVQLTLPIERSIDLLEWQPTGVSMQATLPRLGGKAFYRLTLPSTEAP